MEQKLNIAEILKNLWHPASEEPNIKQGECCVTCLVKFKNESTELCVYFRNPEGWVCVNSFGTELIFETEPHKAVYSWRDDYGSCKCIEIPQGSIKKLIGRELTWNDEPVELK